MKICTVGAELFHAKGQTEKPADLTKLIGVFRQCAEQWRSFLICIMSHLFQYNLVVNSKTFPFCLFRLFCE